MIFKHTELLKIPKILSEPRFTTYLQSCSNNKDEALKLYQWNLEVSSALFVPLHFLEISVRNAVSERIEQIHTRDWAWKQGFIVSLPDPASGYSMRRDLQDTARNLKTIGHVVAEMKFVFWEKMFTKRHEGTIWKHDIKDAFPHAPQDMSTTRIRKKIYDDLFNIRKLRNRIAHHEPIFTRNIQDDYNRIYNLISWRDEATAKWMNHFQKVTKLVEEGYANI